MKTADLNALLDESLKKALSPYRNELREAFAKEKTLLEEVEQFSPQRAEDEFFRIHNAACAGDEEAKKTLAELPWPDLKTFARRYTVLADVSWQSVENFRKSFRPTLLAACGKMLEAVDRVATTAQEQLDAYCAATGEPPHRSAWAEHRAGEMRGLLDAILSDRAEQDARFIRDMVS